MEGCTWGVRWPVAGATGSGVAAAAGRRARDCQVRHVQGLIDAGLITGDAEDQGHVFWASVYGFAGLILLGQISAEEGRRLHRLACRSAIAHTAP